MSSPATSLAPSRRAPRVGLLATVVLVLLACLPVTYIAMRAVQAARNVAYWDEIEIAVALILRLNAGLSADAFLAELFSVCNEHRIVLSRLLFAVTYGLTGTVNFAFISLIGNAALLGLCLVLVGGARTASRRLRLVVILAFGLYQLGNYENFLWSGSSIDHFQVLFWVGATVVALARGGRPAWLLACLCALLASLTLAHGLLAWPIGAALLLQARRFHHLGVWCLLGALVGLGYFSGFSVNGSHRFATLSFGDIVGIGHYWLTLLGAVPALGSTVVAPWLGAALLGLLTWLARNRTLAREPVAFTVALFGVAALALVAVGRTAEVGGLVMSRYLVLGALAWCLTTFMLLERFTDPRRPLRVLVGCLPFLVAFNVASNRAFASSADSWLDCRDIAAARFKQHGVDGRGNFSLFPVPARATTLLNEAERRGVYRMGALCLPRSFPAAADSERIIGRVDELTINDRAAFVRGWAVIPGVRSERGNIHLILRSDTATHIFTTVSTPRPDVADNLRDPQLYRCGYMFASTRDRLPADNFQIGFLITNGKTSEFVMTDHRLDLTAARPTPAALQE